MIISYKLNIVKTIEERNIDFLSYLDICTEHRCNDIFKYLLEKEKKKNGKEKVIEMLSNILMICSKCNNIVTLIECIKNGANPSTRDYDGKTPLHYASIHNNVFATKILLMCDGIDSTSSLFCQ